MNIKDDGHWTICHIDLIKKSDKLIESTQGNSHWGLSNEQRNYQNWNIGNHRNQTAC